MVVEASLPAIGTVLLTAAIDSINPCAIGVLVLLISTLVGSAKKRGNLLKIGFIYIAAVYITYFTAGLGLIAFLQVIPLSVAVYLSIIVAAIIAGGALFEIKDYFWYGKGFSLAISPKRAKQIHNYAKNISLPTIIFLGAFVAAVELPCTGGPYLAITLMLSQNFNFTALMLLALYNLIFVMPLIIILLLVTFGVKKVQHVKMWKQKQRGNMRLAMGLLLIMLAWMLILIANGTINFA